MESLIEGGTRVLSQLAYISVRTDLQLLVGTDTSVAGGFVE